MSVLIKGMEMPPHCTDCIFWHDGVFEHCKLNMEIQNEDVPEYAGQYPDGCPLVEVPPHGRLIDVDALSSEIEKVVSEEQKTAELFKKMGDMQSYFKLSSVQIGMASCRRLLDSAPTIIEAEEGEKHNDH